MKKYLYRIISIAFVFIFMVSCTKSQPVQEPAAAEQTFGTTTIMVYMIGSDLEAKSGAGTDDINEILKSGVNTENNNILVYAGGSPKWHNEYQEEQKNTLLHLTADGFEKADAFEQSNMCTAETLSAFLNYSVENYPADNYALILWNHGNGPLIGYGKDMVHDNDTLTLTEMADALADSPFSADNKLDWVGFDACLMASAELACVWSDYAEFMVASQEVEPAFGWKYDFLKDLGTKASKELIGNITELYLNACVEHFEKKNFTDSISTLSCIDLSFADELKTAINNLFAAASTDVISTYDELVLSRVEARSIGRASTGSEYDLVDLKSLCTTMSSEYPEQTTALTAVIDKMIIKNSTNSEGLSGLSFYYPFYNKSYYQKDWCTTYQNMNIFENYSSYLAEYEKIWLEEDMFDNYASSSTPSMSQDYEFSVDLTDEQAEHFAYARYYIMEKQSDDIYQIKYVCNDTELKDGKLTATFDGNVIYVSDNFGSSVIPATVAHDAAGNSAYYSVIVDINNSADVNFFENSEDYKNISGRFLLSANKTNNTVDIVNLIPIETENKNELSGGKTEDINLDNYTTCDFYQTDINTIIRNEKGVVLPVSEWKGRGSILYNSFAIANGINFEYAPLGSKGNSDKQYALIFEITDTQGQSYCSEPIDIEKVYWNTAVEKEPTRIESNGTFPLLIKEDENFAVYLDTKTVSGKEMLTVTYKNKTGDTFDGYVSLEKANGKFTINSTVSTDVAGKTEVTDEYYFNFGNVASTGTLKNLTSLNLIINLKRISDDKTFWYQEPFEVVFSKTPNISLTYSEPVTLSKSYNVKGAEIPRQILVDDADKTIELIYLTYKTYDYDPDDPGRLEGIINIRNKKSETFYVTLDGIAFDNVKLSGGFDGGAFLPVSAGTESYISFWLDFDTIESTDFNGFQSMNFILRFGPTYDNLWLGYGEYEALDVKLAKKSSQPLKLPASKTKLIEENGVIFSVAGFYPKEYGEGVKWLIIVENTNDYGISFEAKNTLINGKPEDSSDFNNSVFFYDNEEKLAPHQSMEIELSSNSSLKGNVSFTVDIYDYTREKLLCSGTQKINLKTE